MPKVLAPRVLYYQASAKTFNANWPASSGNPFTLQVKSFVHPPELVRVTMEGVCTLLGEPTDWDSARKVLSDTAFVRKLLDYNRDAVPHGAPEKL